jgi:D-arabinose 1-dehydrogenase-like Zn-dependent alcohol dehydrogenase
MVQHTCGRCEWCARSKPMFCEQGIVTGAQISGGHAEYMVAYADATMLLPDGLDYEQAAPLFCAGYTVWSGLRWAEPQPGERLAVVGIGGLGHLAVQYAKAAGFTTIAISHSADSIAGLRPDGRLVLMGFENKPLAVHPGDLIMRRIRILGSQQKRSRILVRSATNRRIGKSQSNDRDLLARRDHQSLRARRRQQSALSCGDHDQQLNFPLCQTVHHNSLTKTSRVRAVS